jgi:hypothetical protein
MRRPLVLCVPRSFIDVALITRLSQGGLLLLDRRLIAKDYLKAWFWIDFVATFPFELVTGGGGGDEGGDGGGSSAAGVGKLGRLGKICKFCEICR